MVYTRRYGQRIMVNTCWNDYADTLDWTVSCPPPEHTSEQLPQRSDWDKGHAH